MDDPLNWLDAELRSLDERDLRRRLRTHEGPQSVRLRIDGCEYVSFAANDYLALANDARIIEAAARAATQWGWGAGASPLVVGHSQAHERLEQRLVEFEGAEAALLFATGFAVNLGVISALMGEGDAIYSDALNHASIVDGCRLSRAAVHIYPHADVSQLHDLLAASAKYRRRLIVTDSLFSMDGDMAPLAELSELAQQHGCMLMVDEAHATGIFGAQGRGIAEYLGCEDAIHIGVGTLSKGLGGVGGFVVGRRSLIDWLINRARPYVFSTALPPSAAAAACAALDVVRDEPWRRQRLLSRAAELKHRLLAQGWDIGPTQSQIIPLLIGDSAQALAAANTLAREGIWVPAIRPPSVPAGQARLRISLSYAHDDAMIDGLVDALGRLAAFKRNA